MELRDKLPYTLASQEESPAQGSAPLPQGTHIQDAVDALVSLGCPYIQAARAISKAVDQLGSDASVEDLIREGLKYRSS